MKRIGRTLSVLWAAIALGCTPIEFSQTHVTFTPPSPESVDVTTERVAILGLQATPALQGFSPALLQALTAALGRTSPRVPAMPFHDVINSLSEHGLSTEYADLIAAFARSGILDRDRLRRIGTALDVRYVFLPGVAQLDQLLVDKFEAGGLKLLRNRVVTLHCWLQLWDTQTGRILFEATGETTSASEVVTTQQLLPLEQISQTLWLRMVRDGLLVQAATARPASDSPTEEGN